MKGFIPLVEEYRGGTLENVHYGAISVVNDRGELLYQAGDPEHVTFLRSSGKPIQAIPVLRRHIDEIYGLTGQETTLFAASHRGESYHIDALESIMRKAAIDEENFYCSASYPSNEAARAERYRNHEPKRRVFHNCSGKHAGLIALCKHMGWDERTYYEPSHPLQLEITRTLSQISEVAEADIPQGIDGCGLPVFALPLRNIALTYVKLACPDLIGDAEIEEAVTKITKLMNEYPDMIADTKFVCSTLLRDPNLVAKGGAKGVYGIGLRKQRIGISLKVSDGSEHVWPCIIASILKQLSYENEHTIEQLYELESNTIVNDGGVVVGERRAVFTLQ